MDIFQTRHKHDDHLLTHRHRAPYATLIVSGSYLEFSIDGPVECAPGTLVVHPSFHAHGNRFSSRGARTLNISLPPDIIVDAYQVVTTDIAVAKEVFMHKPEELVELVTSASPHDSASVPEWCERFVKALGHCDCSIAELAAEIGVSSAYASRTIQRLYGMPPVALRREWRWRKALALLLHGVTPVEVAASAGFADQSHFTRICKNFTGEPPVRLSRKVKFVQDTGV